MSMIYDWWGKLQRGHLVAEADRWTAQGGTVTMADTSAGTNVVEVAVGQESRLAGVQVGDPVVLRLDPAPWAQQPVTATGNTNWDYKPPYLSYSYLYAMIVAVGASSVTLSKRLPQSISRAGKPGAGTDFFMRYAHTDFVHPANDAVYAMHMDLWRPETRLYDVYVGARCWAPDGTRKTITQLEAGRVTVNASVTGATYSIVEGTVLPGRNTTANATFDVSFSAALANVQLPYRLCASGKEHVARFEVVSKLKGGAGGSLECFVVDDEGTVLSPVVEPDMFGGVDHVSVPFKPFGRVRCRLVLRQKGATDASCYVSQVDVREVPSDARTAFRDAFLPGFTFLQGASNSLESAPMYSDQNLVHANSPWDETTGAGIYASALIRPARAYPGGVWSAAGPTTTGTGAYRDSQGGRPMVTQVTDLSSVLAGTRSIVHPGNAGTLALGPTQVFSLMMGVESANSVNNSRKGQSTETAADIAEHYANWRTLALDRSSRILFTTPTRQGRETGGLLADGFPRTELDINVTEQMVERLQTATSLSRYTYRYNATLTTGANTFEVAATRSDKTTTETFTVTRS